MGPEWIIIGVVAAVGIVVAILVLFYRKLSSLQSRESTERNERS